MKKFHVLLGSAFMLTLTATTMSSCSNDSDPVVAEQEDLVEIQMGANVSASADGTRAAALDAWNDTRIGVYGLANALDWDDADNMLFGGAYVNATVASSEVVSFPTDAAGNKYYYPRQQTAKTFSFYGFYPTVAATTTAVTAKAVNVTNSFDGNQDVMAGRSVYLANAWNAKYVREHDTQLPKIVFKHLTTQFKVLLYQGNTTSGFDEDLPANQIASVYFNVPTQYTVKLADADTYNTYEPTVTWNNAATTKAEVIGSTATYPAGVTAETANALNGAVIVPWQDYDASRTNSYKADLTGVYNNLVFVPAGATEYTLYIEFNDSSAPVAVPVKTTGGEAFKAGYSYLVSVKVYGPQLVTAKATLTPWEDGEKIDTVIE